MAEDDSISINKYISSTGICSRREADKWLDAGRVKLNGTLAKKGNRVSTGDQVTVDGKSIEKTEKLVYIALNKPRGIVSTTDTAEKNNIVDFVNHSQRLFHIGRLDKPSEGLIFMTNDGDIVNKILRAGNKHEKEYIVTVDRSINNHFIQKMSEGVPILNTITQPCKVKALGPKKFRIILTQGLNRQIRRMCSYLGYEVKTLKRIRIMHIEIGNLAVGEWRYFTEKEIQQMNKLLQHSQG